jgi:hypothetical protein
VARSLNLPPRDANGSLLAPRDANVLLLAPRDANGSLLAPIAASGSMPGPSATESLAYRYVTAGGSLLPSGATWGSV